MAGVTTKEPRIDSLPKWAQDIIHSRGRRIADLEQELAILQGEHQPGSSELSLRYQTSHNEGIDLPIRFTVGISHPAERAEEHPMPGMHIKADESSHDFGVRNVPGITVRCLDNLLIVPDCRNVAFLTTARWLERARAAAKERP